MDWHSAQDWFLLSTQCCQDRQNTHRHQVNLEMMSGGIFSPMDSFFNIDSANCHPLVCHLCHEQYEHPCLLDCYHTFCASCLRGRAVDSRLSCPLCGHQSIVKGSNGLPPEDRLLKFLVDNSADNEETVQCANCDLECKNQDVDSMYYCNTCNQPLCGTCREDTHKAKMFSRHEIVSLAKRTKEIHKKCSLHEELYIMFSTEKKSMLCINCFRDMQVESRAHCIDIETAYMQGCEKLDQAVMAVKELQTSAREAIILLKAMIGEVRTNVDEEESAISTLFNNMQEKLAERKKILLKAAQSQHEEKERAFKEQLSHLSALLPTLQVHLVTCSAFLSSANKFEFLDLGYQLMERLKKIVKLPHRLKPSQSSKINTDYRSEFARCLEPLLILNHRRSVSLTGNSGASGMSGTSSLLQSSLVVPCHSPSTSDMSLSASVVRKPTSHRYISTKVLLAEGTETSFTEHCRNYENTYRTLQTEIQKLKDQVQEIHRDLTRHHSLIKTDTMAEIMQKSLQIDVQIASEYSSVEMMRTMFEEIWEETLQRVANEQEIYEAQLHDLLQLKQENSYLTTITKQIGPYIRSIAKVKERLEPRANERKETKDDRTETMLKIYEEGAMCGEMQLRNDTSTVADENREKLIDNRTLNMLVEEPNCGNSFDSVCQSLCASHPLCLHQKNPRPSHFLFHV
ncbi:RING finger protein 207-like isoform X1 [Erpetoichthys calabaricus]|uniref:RING finger protein 207-like isoform X1 n=2 Tax=Erpetoichthys calabaricus TaxID=27687 RepID=UPI002234C0CA|nr:RING finger protein 207-like isoform X1 [Erpetoichthys calabaricus]